MHIKRLYSILLVLALLLVGLGSSVVQARWDGGAGTGPGGVGSTNGASNLELWLASDVGVYTNTACTTPAAATNSVACWADQSGNNINFTQGTAGNQPTFGTVSLNGVNILRFDGTTDFLNGGNVLDLTQLSVFTVVVPRNVLATGGDQKIVTRGYDGANTQWEFGTSGTGTVATNDLTFLAYPSAGATSTSTLSNGTPITGGGSYSNANGWRLWFNGQLQGTSANAAPASNARAAVVGAVSTGGTYAAPTVTQRWNGDIAEVIVFSGEVSSAQRNLIDNYMSAKYNIVMLANDYYTGNGAGYYLDVAGIGQENDGDNTEAHSAGLVLQESGGSLANGEYVLAGYASTTNGSSAADLPAGIGSRWQRDWYVDKTGNVDVTLSFDFSEGGLGGAPSGNYDVLYRGGTGGTFARLNLTPTINGDRVQFTVPDASLLDGYYTLGVLESNSPVVVTVNSNADTGDGILSEFETATVSINQLLVTFSEDMDNTTAGDEVTNVANYLLLDEGSVAGFQTIDCAQAKSTGVDAGDAQITVNSVTYDNGTFTATLNLASALPNGIYRLYACGTATLRDLAGNALAGDGTNAGTDFSRNFQVQLAAPGGGAAGGAGGGANILPATGFPMGKMTTLPIQPAGKAYTNTDMVLEIPSLNQKLTIVGVPQTDDTWDVTWLGNSAGWLNGSAFPTWAGNTVLTGHVWDAYNKPGPFANLKTLKYGDQIKIHAWGQVYTYEVRESKLISSRNVKTVLKHEEYDWVTLLSCEFYNPVTGNYIFRRMVRAVLVSVK